MNVREAFRSSGEPIEVLVDVVEHLGDGRRRRLLDRAIAAVRAEGPRLEILLREAPAGAQVEEPVIEVGQLLRRHHLDAGKLAKLSEACVLLQLALLLVGSRTESRLAVKLKIGVPILRLQLGEPLAQRALEALVGAMLGARHLGEHFALRCLHGTEPRVVGGKHRLCRSEVRRHGIELTDQLGELIDALHEVEPLLLAGDRSAVVWRRSGRRCRRS